MSNHLHSDVAVIGGGICGLSLCYWLARKDPTLKIALIEKDVIGSGASSKNAGFLSTGSIAHLLELKKAFGVEKALFWWQFAESNINLLKEHIIEEHSDDLEFSRSGSYTIATCKEVMQEWQALLKHPELNRLELQAIPKKELQSQLSIQNCAGGIYNPTDASINPISLLKKVLEKIRSLTKNFSLLENHNVIEIEEKNTLSVIKTTKNKISTPLLIFATNSYSPLLSSFFDQKVYPIRAQISVTRPVADLELNSLLYLRPEKIYLRQLRDKRVIIGGARSKDETAEVGYDLNTTATIQIALENTLKKCFPNFDFFPKTDSWSGTMGFTSSTLPLSGKIPDKNQWYLVGFSGRGMSLSFHAAKTVVDLL